jgi:hypothetical protein
MCEKFVGSVRGTWQACGDGVDLLDSDGLSAEKRSVELRHCLHRIILTHIGEPSSKSAGFRDGSDATAEPARHGGAAQLWTRSGDEAETARFVLVRVDHEVALEHVAVLVEGRLQFIP